MTVYSNKEVLYGKIEYRRQKVPYGSFFLSDGIDVSPDDEIKIIGNYKGLTSTRTIVSGINGVTAVGTDNFTSSGVTFSSSGIVAGDMLIIKGSGSDAGCYIVDTVDSETQLSLDDHAGNPVSFSGDTALEYEVGLIIFRGIIDKTDFEANQTIEVFSATEEITQERPTGSYYGYSEVIVGEMISQSSLGNTNINYTESTLTIYPNADAAIVGDVDDPAPANNDNIMWNDLDGGTDGEYIHIRESIIPWDYLELGFTNHSLSVDYHYNIYKVVVNFRNKYHPDNTGFSLCFVDFYDGFNWYHNKDASDMEYGAGTQTWHDTSITFDGLNITEDDINNFKVFLGVLAPLYGVEEGNIIDWVNITVYYRYYDDFIDIGSYKHSLVCSGEKTIADYANLYAIDEQMTWYLDTSLYFYFRNADGDSGEDFAKTNYMKNIIGDRNNKTYSRVILFGGYTSGVQMTSSTGSGFPLWKDTYSTINDQTQLDNLASAILTEQSANQYVIQIYREDSTDGLYQVGETVTLPADPNQIKFSDSDRLIPAGQYILNKIDYILNDGQYLILDIEIIDGLIFSNPRQDNTTGSNAENIANEATVQISQVGGGESVGEANTGQNIGSDGVGVYDGKSGVTLQFRNIAPASNKVTVVENGDDIDIDVVPANIYTDVDAVAAVATADDYLKNDANDETSGDLTVANLITAGLVDGQDVAAMAADLANQCTVAEAIAGVLADDKYLKNYESDAMVGTLTTTGLICNGNIQINIGSTVDGIDISVHAATATAHQDAPNLIAAHAGDDNAHHEVFESLVEDLSPQLGGDLDLNAKDIKEGAVMLYDVSDRKLFPDKIILALGSTIDKFDSDVNLAGDNTDVPTSLAVKTYVDASIKTNEYYAPINAGLGGFIEQTGIGSSYFAPMNDVSAYAEASLFIKDGGSFKVSIVHVSDGGNNGKTASGVLYVSYDVADATDAWDINGVNFDLALGNANILKIQEYGAAFTVADNSKIGLTWGKDDAAGGAVGNMFVYGFVLKRQ